MSSEQEKRGHLCWKVQFPKGEIREQVHEFVNEDGMVGVFFPGKCSAQTNVALVDEKELPQKSDPLLPQLVKNLEEQIASSEHKSRASKAETEKWNAFLAKQHENGTLGMPATIEEAKQMLSSLDAEIEAMTIAADQLATNLQSAEESQKGAKQKKVEESELPEWL